jgi:hypothetical protein
MAMAFSYIPDPPERSAAFEPLLDELAAFFRPDQDPPATFHLGPAASGYQRCEAKRSAIGRAAGKDLEAVRGHAPLLLRAVVHDQCRSGIQHLVKPLIAALGYRQVQEALISYVETGTDAEAIGATMAMYWAQPLLSYSNWDRREPTAESKATRDSLADLRDRYRQACLHAFVARNSPDARFALSLSFTLDPRAYPAEVLPELDHARTIVLADPGRYERIMHTLNSHSANPAAPGTDDALPSGLGVTRRPRAGRSLRGLAA